MSLRLRLTIAMTVFVLIGLVVAGAVTFASLRSFLVQRVDQQLEAVQDPWPVSLHPGSPPRKRRPTATVAPAHRGVS